MHMQIAILIYLFCKSATGHQHGNLPSNGIEGAGFVCGLSYLPASRPIVLL
jgi:hypothetical protein